MPQLIEIVKYDMHILLIDKNVMEFLCSIDNEWNIRKAYANEHNFFSFKLF